MRLLIAFFCLFTACMPRATERLLQQASLHLHNFDRTAIDSLPKYERMRIFLELHAPLLVSYRDSIFEEQVKIIRGEGTNQRKIEHYPEFYDFNPDSKYPDAIQIVPHLQQEFNALYKTLGMDKLHIFQVYRTGNISIFFKASSLGDGLYISHTLIWNPELPKQHNYRAHRDTLLNGNCIYRITLTEHQYQ